MVLSLRYSLSPDTVICPNCGISYPARRRKCPHCGRRRNTFWPLAPKAALPTVPISSPALIAAPPDSSSSERMVRPRPARQSRAPMWFELFGGSLLGLHGLGMLAVHRYRAAVFWLLFSAVGWALRFAAIAL